MFVQCSYSVCVHACIRALPVLKMVVLDLRLFALRVSGRWRLHQLTTTFPLSQAENELVPTGRAKPGEMHETAAATIMSCFRVCVSDRWVRCAGGGEMYYSFLLVVLHWNILKSGAPWL